MKTAVLLMAYGSPRSPREVEPYFTDIRGGRPPSPAALQELTSRYRSIGGRSPLNEITGRQAGGLAAHLAQRAPDRFEVFVGMKHWHPYITEAVAQIKRMEIREVIGIVLAPHFSAKSIGEYESRVRDAQSAAGWSFELKMVQRWYDEPAFVDMVAANIKQALQGWDPGDGATRVFFSAHSIPARIVEQGDPYAAELTESADMFARAAAVPDFQIAWQSASHTNEPWLGPDILEELEAFAKQGGRRALVAPVGFVADHLEVLFDIDVECAAKARELGLEWRRTESPNADPRFVRALGDIVMRYAG